MHKPYEVYRLHTCARAIEMLDAFKGKSIMYNYQLIEGGADAAIEISNGEINAFIDGAPCPPGHEFLAFIENYRHPILRRASEITGPDGGGVVLVGKWDDVLSLAGTFIGYLIHVVSNSGNVQTRVYFREFKEWDDTPDRDLLPTVADNTSGQDCIDSLGSCVEEIVDLDRLWVSPTGRTSVDSVFFRPMFAEDEDKLPFLLSRHSAEQR